ncbi:cytoskeletal protein CcmA (bactofilin family) [Oxalobacteraceae bacterium GrIS 1.11]
MFARNARDAMDSLIGAATQIDGHVLFKGGLRIDGQVRGDVIAEAGQHSYLVLSEHGRIDGEVRCSHLIVNGQINGSVHAAEMLEIQPKGRIIGSVFYKVMEMHGGALISGQLCHHDSADSVLHLAVSEA